MTLIEDRSLLRYSLALIIVFLVALLMLSGMLPPAVLLLVRFLETLAWISFGRLVLAWTLAAALDVVYAFASLTAGCSLVSIVGRLAHLQII
jgi:hypothetical protein